MTVPMGRNPEEKLTFLLPNLTNEEARMLQEKLYEQLKEVAYCFKPSPKLFCRNGDKITFSVGEAAGGGNYRLAGLSAEAVRCFTNGFFAGYLLNRK